MMLCLLTLLISCCAMKFGSMPDTQALQLQLKQNISTKADVLKVLGPPRGYGMARFPNVPNPRVIWFYEYLESDGKHARLKMLLMFFGGEKYEGHLWFSSFEKIKVIR